MKKVSVQEHKQLIKDLQKQVKSLQAQLREKQNPTVDENIRVQVTKAQTRFTEKKNPDGPDTADATFFMRIAITAKKETVYVPLSIASSQRATGFMYQIEGTARGEISQADVSVQGEGVTQVALGTILYAKIPAKKTGIFRALVEIRGQMGKEYTIVINRINYKFNTRDTRYQRYLQEVRSKTLVLR